MFSMNNGERTLKNKTNIFSNQLMTVLVILIALVIFFAIVSKGFFTTKNFYNIMQQIAVIGIITVAQTFVIITAGIDLSQGAIIGLTTIVSAGFMVDLNLPIWAGVLAGLCVGVLVGVVNGVLISYLRLPAFIATLGTMSVAEAVALLVKGGNDIYNLPKAISEFGRQGIGGFLPNIAIIMIVIAVLMHILLSKTSFGRYVYSVGSNMQAANFSGVKVKSVLFRVYVLAGFLCSVAGVIMMCRMNSGVAIAGKDYQMDSISAVVIGGGSLFGGEGSIAGAMIGAFIMSVLANGLQIMGVSSYWQQLITGIVLVVAVLMDTMRRKKSMG